MSAKPFQPPPHPAELWVKPNHVYGDVLRELKACGWVDPTDNVDQNGKIDMNVYAMVDACMQSKEFVYIGRTPLTCKRLMHRDIPACRTRITTEE
jgi:hypothetical protein